MLLVLKKYKSRHISDMGINVYRDIPFECPYDIAKKLMRHGDYEIKKEKKRGEK